MIAKADGRPVDLTDKSLSGLDLSGIDLKGANLRSARMNRTNLRGADLSGARFEMAWLLGADLSGAKLVRAGVSPPPHPLASRGSKNKVRRAMLMPRPLRRRCRSRGGFGRGLRPGRTGSRDCRIRTS